MKNDQNQQPANVRETRDADDGPTMRPQTVQAEKSTSGAVVAQRVVYYVTGVIVALLALRVLLLLLAANQGAPFVDFIYSVSSVFAVPFYGMFGYQPVYGQSVFEISSVVAILVYSLVGMGIAKLFTLTGKRADV